MPTEVAPSTTANHAQNAWNERPSYVARRRARFGRILVGLALIGGLGAWLTFQLSAPLLHPNTHVVSLSGAKYQSFQLPPLPFASNDASSLDSLDRALYPHQDGQTTAKWTNLEDAQQMPKLFEQFAEFEAANRDVLILFVFAHGLSDEGNAYLLCGNFDAEQPSRGRWSVSKLIEQVQASDASVKLLVVDSGWLTYDPRLGIVVNEFGRLLGQAVAESGDERLWLLASTSPLESSFSSLALQQSIFGFFTVQGLHGAADLNGDMNVGIDELHRYVSASVSVWVEQNTGGLGSQTPRLIWGGGNNSIQANAPILISVQPFERPDGSPARHDRILSKQEVPPLNIPNVISAAEKRSPTVVFPVPSKSSNDAQTGNRPSASNNASPAAVPTANGSSSAGRENAPSSSQDSQSGQSKAPPSSSAASASQSSNSQGAVTSSAKGTNDASSSSAPSSSAKGDAKLAALVVEGWQIHDQMLQPNRGAALFELAPQLVRAYERTLLGYEQMLRRGSSNKQQIATGLEGVVIPLRSLISPPSVRSTERATVPGFVGSGSLADQLLAARSVDQLPALDAPSLGLTIQLAGNTASPSFVSQVAEFDRMFATGTRAKAVAWLKKAATDGFDRYLEVRFASQIVPLTEIDWSLVKQAVQSRRIAEQTAASWCFAWTKDRVEQADKLRMRGELELFYRVGEKWQQRASSFFDQAVEIYQSAERDDKILRAAKDLRDTLLHRAPYYLRWHAVGTRSLRFAPDADQLNQLLDALGQLVDVLEQAEPSRVVSVERAYQRLVMLADNVEAGVGPSAVDILLSGAVAPGDVYRVDSLLATPLLAAEQRVRLLNYAPHADKVMAEQVQLPSGSELALREDAVTPKEWRWMLDQLELESKLVALVHLNSTNPSDFLQRFSATITAANLALEQYVDAPESSEARQSLWLSFREAGQHLKAFYAGLPQRIEAEFLLTSDLSDPATRSAHRRQLYSVLLAMYLVDGRDAHEIEQVNPRSLLRRAELFDLLVWNGQRAKRLRSESPPLDLGFFDSIARQYRTAAMSIPNQPTVAQDAAPTLQMKAPQTLDLTLKGEDEFSLALSSTLGGTSPVWISAYYDTRLLEVSSDTRHPIAHNLVIGGPLNSGSATLQIAPGLSEMLRLRVKRKGEAAEATRIILTAATASEVIRNEVDVLLPQADPVEVKVTGTPETWAASPGALNLFPFPNRVTQYQIALLNQSEQSLSFDVSIMALSQASEITLPRGAIPAADADRLLAEFGDSQVLAEIKKLAVPAGGAPILLPFPKSASTPTKADTSASNASPPTTDANAASKTPAVQSLQFGALLVFTDTSNGRKSIWPIRIKPQRPHRFLDVHVAYSQSSESFTLSIRAKNPAAMPTGGVKVSCEVVEAISKATLLTLTGKVDAPRFTTDLNASVPADGRQVILRVNVDGYPRAFTYKYVCNGDAATIPEASSLLDARVTSPTAGTAYSGSLDSIEAKVEIDTPAGAFDDPANVAEVGIDQRRDRDLTNDAVITLHNDRDVQVTLKELAPKGLISLNTSVSDFTTKLPAVGRRNNRANVLAVVHVGDRTVRSEPIEVIFDSTAPTVGSITLMPDGFVTAGEPIIVTVDVQDALSGVNEVNAAIDIDRAKKFSATEKPTKAAQQTDGSWMVQLPTSKVEPGNYNILLQATDLVGNSSPYKQLEITVLSKEQAAARIASMVVPVTGTVTYGDQGQEGIDVTLTKAAKTAKPANKNEAKGAVVAKTKTNSQGEFMLPRVAPGDYQLTAEGIVRNKVRKAEAKVEVKPGQPPQPIEMKLPP